MPEHPFLLYGADPFPDLAADAVATCLIEIQFANPANQAHVLIGDALAGLGDLLVEEHEVLTAGKWLAVVLRGPAARLREAIPALGRLLSSHWTVVEMIAHGAYREDGDAWTHASIARQKAPSAGPRLPDTLAPLIGPSWLASRRKVAKASYRVAANIVSSLRAFRDEERQLPRSPRAASDEVALEIVRAGAPPAVTAPPWERSPLAGAGEHMWAGERALVRTIEGQSVSGPIYRIHLVDAAGARPLDVPVETGGEAPFAAFAPSGRHAVIGTGHGAFVIDLETGAARPLLRARGQMTSVAFVGGGRAAVLSRTVLAILDVETADPVAVHEVCGLRIQALRGGDLLAFTAIPALMRSPCEVAIIDARTPDLRLVGRLNPYVTAFFEVDDRVLAYRSLRTSWEVTNLDRALAATPPALADELGPRVTSPESAQLLADLRRRMRPWSA